LPPLGESNTGILNSIKEKYQSFKTFTEHRQEAIKDKAIARRYANLNAQERELDVREKEYQTASRRQALNKKYAAIGGQPSSSKIVRILSYMGEGASKPQKHGRAPSRASANFSDSLFSSGPASRSRSSSSKSTSASGFFASNNYFGDEPARARPKHRSKPKRKTSRDSDVDRLIRALEKTKKKRR
jgi:hypothetical protein